MSKRLGLQINSSGIACKAANLPHYSFIKSVCLVKLDLAVLISAIAG